MANITREFVFKVVLIGEGSVGKTSIRAKFMGESFTTEYIKTIGADFASKAIILGENKVHFQIWDLAGQRMYKHVRSSFYSGCKCCFLIFDLTVNETLWALDDWIDEAIENSGGYLKIFIVLGNKNDLKDQRTVNQGDVDKLLKQLRKQRGIEAKYLETSALTGENIDEAFKIMGKLFLEIEGFPRRGEGAETADDEVIAKYTEEIQKLITAPAPLYKTEENIPEEIEAGSSQVDLIQQIQMHFSSLEKRIDRLAQITAGLEERMLLAETHGGRTADHSREILELKTMLHGLEENMETSPLAKVDIDPSLPASETSLDFAVPVPAMEDLTNASSSEADYESLDLSALGTAEVIDDEDVTVATGEVELTSPGDDSSVIEKDVEEIRKQAMKESEIPPPKKEELEDIKQEKKEKTQGSQPRCPKCGGPLSFIKQYERWYCYRCKSYV